MSGGPPKLGTYELITAPNALKARLGGGLGIDRQLARQAGAAVAGLQNRFLRRVAAALGEIAALTPGIEGDRDRMADVARIAAEIQLQAAAFDYPLISDICASLHSYLEHFRTPSATTAVVVRAHAAALQSVVDHGIAGDGGPAGLDLVKRLAALVAGARG